MSSFPRSTGGGMNSETMMVMVMMWVHVVVNVVMMVEV
ncbi:hypothetical protein Tco_0761390, partial [Tanacetum coccineum]